MFSRDIEVVDVDSAPVHRHRVRGPTPLGASNQTTHSSRVAPHRSSVPSEIVLVEADNASAGPSWRSSLPVSHSTSSTIGPSSRVSRGSGTSTHPAADIVYIGSHDVESHGTQVGGHAPAAQVSGQRRRRPAPSSSTTAYDIDDETYGSDDVAATIVEERRRARMADARNRDNSYTLASDNERRYTPTSTGVSRLTSMYDATEFGDLVLGGSRARIVHGDSVVGNNRGRFAVSRTSYMPVPLLSHVSYAPPRAHLATLAFTNRDFGPEDYEMLLQLDERAKEEEQRKSATERQIKASMLPIITIPGGKKPSKPSTNASVDIIEIDVEDESKPSTSTAEQLEQCAVCMEDMAPGATVKVIPACLHKFHPDCIDPWIMLNPVCPICKAAV